VYAEADDATREEVIVPLLDILPADATRYDIVSLGEVMLRLDPGDHRIASARHFEAWEGGAEYNVARSGRQTFGLRGAIVTAFADNEIGRLLGNLLAMSGLDLDFVRWRPYDGIGQAVRNGLYFAERGFGVRGAVACSDRGHTAISQLTPEDIDLHELFEVRRTRWFHTGGIMAGLSEQAAATTEAVVAAAKAAGAIVSYDLNYRPSLWASHGGLEGCRAVNRRLAAQVDVVFGNEEDYDTCLGIAAPGTDASYARLDPRAYQTMIERTVEQYPNLKVAAVSLRQVVSASINDWGGLAWSAPTGFVAATPRPGLEIYDRVGGGDSFAAGVIYGLFHDDLQLGVEYGAANGAIAMTTPGDTTTASLAEVRRLAEGGSARIQR